MTDGAFLKQPSNSSLFNVNASYYDDYYYDYESPVQFVVYKKGEDYFVTHSESSRAT